MAVLLKIYTSYYVHKWIKVNSFRQVVNPASFSDGRISLSKSGANVGIK